MTDLYGTNNNEPVNHDIVWMYPVDGSTLTIDLCHVRLVDNVRLRFDFEAHEWVAEQEVYRDDDDRLLDWTWREVARWSGNAPSE